MTRTRRSRRLRRPATQDRTGDGHGTVEQAVLAGDCHRRGCGDRAGGGLCRLPEGGVQDLYSLFRERELDVRGRCREDPRRHRRVGQQDHPPRRRREGGAESRSRPDDPGRRRGAGGRAVTGVGPFRPADPGVRGWSGVEGRGSDPDGTHRRARRVGRHQVRIDQTDRGRGPRRSRSGLRGQGSRCRGCEPRRQRHRHSSVTATAFGCDQHACRRTRRPVQHDS